MLDTLGGALGYTSNSKLKQWLINIPVRLSARIKYFERQSVDNCLMVKLSIIMANHLLLSVK